MKYHHPGKNKQDHLITECSERGCLNTTADYDPAGIKVLVEAAERIIREDVNGLSAACRRELDEALAAVKKGE